MPGYDKPQKYIEYIKAGIDETAKDDKTLLLFSGGESRNDISRSGERCGPKSEVLIYWMVADHLNLWKNDVDKRVALEEFARDSLESLLFGICRFFECVGTYSRNC